MKYPLITKSRVREYALELAKKTRHQKFSRVGDSFFMKVENQTRLTIESLVAGQPSKGMTLK